MKRLLITATILLILFPGVSYPAETELYKLRKTSSSTSVQLYLQFTDLPAHKKVQKGKRIDIILDAILTNTSPVNFEVDDKVVKFLTQSRNNETVITFFLRYEPQQVKISSPQKNTMVVDILLGNQFTKQYPELSSKLEGLEIVQQQSADFANPFVSNPYAGNWNLFFSKYEPAIPTSAPLKFTIPPFPVISLLSHNSNIDVLSPELFEMSSQKLWDDMITKLYYQINSTQDLEEKKLLALTFGEALLRAGKFNASFKQLYLIKDNYPDEPVGIAAAYMLALLRALYEDPFIADIEYRSLDSLVDQKFPLSPFILLSQIETAIATKQTKRALEILQRDNIAFPPYLALIKRLRFADYWFASNNHVKAYVGYSLIQDKTILEDHPYSLNGYCDTLYRQKKYKKSSACFQKLSRAVSDKKQRSMIALKKSLAELRFKSPRDMYAVFSTIEDTYPKSTAGFMASLKKADIRYISQPNWRKESVKTYKKIASEATDRKVSEEAALKEAIAYAEVGSTSKSIELVMDFLRFYRKGDLTATAQALLIELLPETLKNLMDDGQYVKALVLAKKNRELFQKNWVDINLLAMLAKAYHELSIYEEARKLYLYLLKTSQKKTKEPYYLPLISILYEQKYYSLVEDYIAEYTYNYPDGQDLGEVSKFRLKAFIKSEKISQAIDLLETSPPTDAGIKETAAALFFKNDQYEKTISHLSSDWKSGDLSSPDALFMLAESYFLQGNLEDSKIIYSQIRNEEKFFDQSSYRLALIERDNGFEDKALKLFQEIVEKGIDPLWRKLAVKEIEFSDLKQRY